MNPSGKAQSDDIYTAPTSDTSKIAAPLTCTQTYYYMSSPSLYFDDSNFYNEIFETGTNFWLASRCVNCYISGFKTANFGLRYVGNYKNLSGCYLFRSVGNRNSDNNHLAPVVTFDSAVQVKSGSGTTDDPFIIGK